MKSYRHHLLFTVLGVVLIYWLIEPSLPAFSDYRAGEERKQAFFDYFLPLVQQENREVLESREALQQWYADRKDLGWWSARQVRSLAQDYDMESFALDEEQDWQTLLRRVDVVPPSLALAQAAKESGWGTSRFAREGNNFFGQWCFVEGCGLVPKQRGDSQSHEVAVFDSPRESVARYLHNLNTHQAYRELRRTRAQLRKASQGLNGLRLAGGLSRYSTRGQDYVDEIRAMIRHNDLTRFDQLNLAARD